MGMTLPAVIVKLQATDFYPTYSPRHLVIRRLRLIAWRALWRSLSCHGLYRSAFDHAQTGAIALTAEEQFGQQLFGMGGGNTMVAVRLPLC